MNRSIRRIWDNPWFTIPVLLFLNIAMVVAYFMPYGAEILWLNSWRRQPFNFFFTTMTYFGEAYAFIVAGLGMLFYRYRYTMLILVAGLLTMGISYVLKHHIGTIRPLTWFETGGMRDELIVVPGVELASGFTSFPSGHTMAAFTLYSLLAGICTAQRPGLGLLFALIAILVGVSRIFLAQHFLADVLGGAVFGLLLGGLVWRLERWAVWQRLGGSARL